MVSEQPWWVRLPMSVWGTGTIALGWLAVLRGRDAPSGRTGRLAIVMGVTYYASVLRASEHPLIFAAAFSCSYVWIAVLGHLVMTWWHPTTRLRAARGVVIAGYIGAFGSQSARYLIDRPAAPKLPWWDEEERPRTPVEAVASSLLTALTLIGLVVVVRRWASSRGPGRHLSAPIGVVTAASAGLVVAVGAATVLAAPIHVRTGLTAATLIGGQVSVLAAQRIGRTRASTLRWRVASAALGLEPQHHSVDRPAELERALTVTLDDPRVRLLFPAGEDRFVDVHGALQPVPPADGDLRVSEVHRGPRLLALLLYSRTRVPVEDVAATVLAVAGLAIESATAQALITEQRDEIHRSRERLATAGLDERRRIQQDLHDGAQQMLYSVLATLDQVRHELTHSREGSRDPVAPCVNCPFARDHRMTTRAEVLTVIDRAHSRLTAAIAELRALTRGIYPAVLTEHGLAAAVESLADTCSITLIATVPAGRWPVPVEVTLYFVAAECITNTVKHTRCDDARVRVIEQDGVLQLSVQDDGGGGAHVRPGGGLANLRDRVAALGGTLDVLSDDHGTTVTACIPSAVVRPRT
ncbi:sensor histidine kinase [Kineococcus gypseus]|uniref:sensor histidine kinase n=1 Tax=Kineococcus gypseus TaxID=1637102 RepID=UPI003D7E3ABE